MLDKNVSRFAIYILHTKDIFHMYTFKSFFERASPFSPLKEKKREKYFFYFYALFQKIGVCGLGSDLCLERTKFKVRKSIFSFVQSEESDQIKSDSNFAKQVSAF